MLRHFYTDDHTNYQLNQNYPQDHRSPQQPDDRRITSVQFQDVEQSHYYYDHRSSIDETMCAPTLPTAPTSRRYSLSTGSDFFPAMSSQELDKIDATQHNFGTRVCYAPLDAKLFDDDLRVDRVDMYMPTNIHNKNNGIDDSIRYINSMRKKAPSYNVAEEDYRITKVPRNDHYTSYSSSQGNSMCSISDSYYEEDDCILPQEFIRLENNMRDRTWKDVVAGHNQMMTSREEAIAYPDYDYQQYEPINVFPAEMDTINQHHQQYEEYEMAPLNDPEPVEYNPDYWTQTMESLSSSMAETFKSQQSIHDWDKKMGLKRSHSKTMRMSMRTRKKLRALIKKELGY